MEKRNAKNFTIDTLKGITLGVSVAIPGLSAGTIAVSEGCYDKIIIALTDLKKKFKDSFFFLLPYAIGLIIGALAAFIGIKHGYDNAPFTLTGLFGGLIIGSLPVAIKELKKGNTTKEKLIHCLVFILALTLSVSMGVITALCKISLEEYMKLSTWWMYFVLLAAGFLAAFACVVPGISGSMTLMIMGLYDPFLSLFIGERSVFRGRKEDMAMAFVYVLVVLVGAVFGLILASKVMKKCLKDYRVSTFYAILGLIIGSTIAMFINSQIYPKYSGVIDENGTVIVQKIQNWDYIVGAVLFVVGFAISFGLIILDKKLSSKKMEALANIENSKNNQETNNDEITSSSLASDDEEVKIDSKISKDNDNLNK